MKMLWGYGSVGRASRSQREGQRFESAYLHHKQPKLNRNLGCLFKPKVWYVIATRRM